MMSKKYAPLGIASSLLVYTLVAGCERRAQPAETAAQTPTAPAPAAPVAPLPAQPEATPEAVEAQRQAVEAFRQKRDTSLRKKDGWLTLINLAWLQPGDNAVGGIPTADVVLAPSVAANFGKLVVPGPGGHAAELIAAPGQSFTIEGKTLERAALHADVHENGPTVVEIGTISFFVIDRQGKLGVRVRDIQAATLANFHGVETFPTAFDWRIRGRWEPYDPPRKLEIPNVLGQVSAEDSPGAFVFERGGQTWRLEAVEGGGEQGIHFIFSDGTSGKATYGGGRFLDGQVEQATRKEPGTALVDFNLAYNPPCVFTPYATCPLPPAANKIALPIEAGEKVWGTH